MNVINSKLNDEQNISFEFDVEEMGKQSLIEYKGGYFNPTDFINYNLICKSEINELFDIDTSNDTSINDKWDYIAAVASGLLCGAIDIFYIKDFSLKDASDWGNEEISKFVQSFAKIKGYKGASLKGAINHLEQEFILPSDKLTSDFGGGLQHHLRDFEHHPTILGLFFSILSQFTHKGFGTDTEGNFIIRDIPISAFTAKNNEEKIFNGIVIWLFHLISDMAGSSNNPGKGTGIPGVLLSSLKEISTLPLFKDIKLKYKDNDIELSVFISKLFNGTYFKGETYKDNIRFDLRTEIGILHEITNQITPIIINECIIRSVFALRRFYFEIKEKNIKHVSELNKVDYLRFIPYRDQALNRMLTIGHGTFSVLDVSHALIYSAVKNIGNKKGITKDFLVKVNVVGIGCFAIACKVELDTFTKKQAYKNAKYQKIMPNLKDMTLDMYKMQILLSLEYHKCFMDIQTTKNKLKRDCKKIWLEKWESCTLDNLTGSVNYIIKDIAALKEAVKKELNETANDSWMYIIALELYTFTPYYSLGIKEDEKFKKLKLNYKKFDEEFMEIQDFVNQKEYKEICKLYKNNCSCLTGKKFKIVAGTVSVVAVTAATGGLALYFAPQIATGLVGSSFVGLHGAALTSASLAMLGGGSLAAGGLGMAEGTAFIAGGGAILGLTSTTTISSASYMLLSDSNYTTNECAKLLTFVQYVLLEKLHEIDVAKKLLSQMEIAINNIEKMIDELPKDLKDKKKIEKNQKKSLSYFVKSKDILKKQIEKAEK